MARSRAIKDEFFSSEQLAKVSRDARLLFVAMWLQADHWGVLLNTPRKIMVEAFPYDDESSPFAITETQFHQWLEDLFALRFILRFEYRGRKYIYCRSWEEHQTIQHREKQKHNAIIPPDILRDIVATVLDENQPPLPNLAPSGKQNGKSIPNESGSNPEPIPNRSGTKVREGKVREGKLRESEHSPGSPTRVPISADETAAVRQIKETDGLLKAFVNYLDQYKHPWAAKLDWREKGFKAASIRKLAVEFVEVQRQEEEKAKTEDEVVRMLEKTGSMLGRFVEYLNKHKNAKRLKKVWHDQRFQAPTIRSLATEFMNLEKEPEAVNDKEPESGKGKDKEKS